MLMYFPRTQMLPTMVKRACSFRIVDVAHYCKSCWCQQWLELCRCKRVQYILSIPYYSGSLLHQLAT